MIGYVEFQKENELKKACKETEYYPIDNEIKINFKNIEDELEFLQKNKNKLIAIRYSTQEILPIQDI